MRYRNIDLELTRDGERFRLTLRGAAAPVDLRVDPFTVDFETDLARLADGDGDEAYFRDLGVRLYRALFPDPAARMLVRAIDHQRLHDGGVCIRLRLRDAAVRALPWEFLFRPDWRRFLAASVESPLVRYLEVRRPIAELAVRPPLRVLVVAPESARHSPAGALDAEREIAGLRETLAPLDALASLHILDRDVRFERLRDALIGTRYHVLHFIGHGSFDGGAARLRFDRAGGGEEGVDEARFAELLVNHPSIKLAFLNACESAAVTATEAVHGMAPRLVEAGVPAVVAMQYRVRDDAAIAFSRVFYRSLFQGADRGRVDVAMSHARSALVGDYGDQREFGAPVLYLRAPAGLLFDAEAPGAKSDRLIRGDEIGRATAVEQTLAANVALGASADRQALSSLRRAFTRSNLTRACAVAALFATLLAPGLVRWIEYELDLVVVAMRDWLRPVPWRPDVRIVEITEKTERALGKPFRGAGSDVRSDYAQLIDRLSAWGARSLAFNLNLAVDKPSDPVLTAAIMRARDRGTSVVFAPADVGSGADGTTLKRAFVDAGARWGTGCWQRDERLYTTSVPLAAVPPGHVGPAHPAFGLAAVHPGWVVAHLDTSAHELILAGAGPLAGAPAVRKVGFSAEGRIKGSGPACSLIPPGSRTADLIIEFPPHEGLHDQRAAFEDLVGSAGGDATAYRGAVVIVGNRFKDSPVKPGNVPRLFGAQQWPALDFTAALANTLLREVAVQRLHPLGQLLAVAGAFVLALLFGAWRPGATLTGVPLTADGGWRPRRALRWLATLPAWLAIMLGAGLATMLAGDMYFAVWYATLAAWLGQEAGAYLTIHWLSRSAPSAGDIGRSHA